ncbi:putative phage tail protein [Bacillus thuringiensis]|uniref:putative phage tail protein n=1 Tax=Bacillus thuringiensis TaxID=1428 RepID=UPI00207A3C61|nr:putative phage tail protein [Bacillus thuringiensis]USL15799.1 YmfQ family protein [Bacillus thuringiensis]
MSRRDEIVEQLLEHSMKEYRSSHLFNSLMQIAADEKISEEQEFEDTKAQMRVETATWGIADWEREYSIRVDENKPLNQRVSFVLSKQRSAGVTRIPLIKKVAESFQYGEVDVQQDIPNYTINISFIGKLGIPPNINDIQFALRSIVPAHIDINYVFTYTTWNEFEGYKMKWDKVKELQLTWDDIAKCKQTGRL